MVALANRPDGQIKPIRPEGTLGVSPGHANARSSVIDAIRATGEISRTRIASLTGLTGATVSKEIRNLIAEGLVIETGQAASTGGRAQVLLQLDRKSRYAAGLHLDQDGAKAVLLDIGGDVVAQRQVRWDADADPDDVVQALCDEVFAMLASVAGERDRLLGIGLASPGPIRPGEGIASRHPGSGGWLRFPIADRLRDLAGIPVTVDNDATAAAVGELWTGGARDATAFSVLYMAMGVGSGTVVDGVPYRGVSASVGEVGHTTIDLDGPECWCGNTGCIEAIGAPVAVVAQARAAGLPINTPPEDIVGAFGEVAAAARAGDERAAEIIHNSARVVAVAAHTLCSMMSVDLLILTGPAFDVAGDLYLPEVHRRVDTSLVAFDTPQVRVEVSKHASRSPAVGAAALVLQDAMVPRQYAPRIADFGVAV